QPGQEQEDGLGGVFRIVEVAQPPATGAKHHGPVARCHLGERLLVAAGAVSGQERTILAGREVPSMAQRRRVIRLRGSWRSHWLATRSVRGSARRPPPAPSLCAKNQERK